jgi:hypothetical protein
MVMVEMNVLLPGLTEYSCTVDGDHTCTTSIPDLFISETSPRIVAMAYPYLAHCWLLNETISDAAVEACMWELLDGNEDERVIASDSNTLIQFWQNYKICLLNHFAAVAPPKIYRDIVGVFTDTRFPNYAIWKIDNSILNIIPYGTHPLQTAAPIDQISKYF